MKRNSIFYILLLFFYSSCYMVEPAKDFDPFDEKIYSDQNIEYHIKKRLNDIEKLKQKIKLIENYNSKYRYMIDYDSGYQIDNASSAKVISKNQELINVYKVKIKKLQTEVKLLSKRSEIIK